MKLRSHIIYVLILLPTFAYANKYPAMYEHSVFENEEMDTVNHGALALNETREEYPFKDNKTSHNEPSTKKTDLIISALHSRLKQNNIMGTLIIGGGVAYDSINYQNDVANDIDGMFMFPTRSELEKFIKTNDKDQLRKIFGYDDSFVFFDKEEIQAFLENAIPVMRVAGVMDGVKVTVKLTDYQTLSENTVGKPFQVLSKLKDRRIYKGISLMGDEVKIMLINKTLSFKQDPAFIILDRNYYQYKETLVPGLITDYLITAKAINDYQSNFTDLQIKKRQQFVELTSAKGCLAPQEKISQHLIREKKFSTGYKDKINIAFDEIIDRSHAQIPGCTQQPEKDGFLVSVNPDIFYKSTIQFTYKEPLQVKPGPFPKNTQALITRALNDNLHLDKKTKIVPLNDEEKSYSSNPLIGKIYLGPYSSSSKPMYFYKFMREKDPASIINEVNSVANLEQLFTHIIKPVYVDPQYRFCIQPYFDGEPLVKYIKSNFEENATFVENIELRRSEEMLNAYIASLEQAKMHTTVGQRIHILYYDRLVGERIKNYYTDKNITLPSGEVINFEKFKKLTPVINGVEYPTLEDIISKAIHDLDPEYLNAKVKIYGFGDNHAGNILVKEDGQYVTIDYEYASIAHPCEDLAKTIYNDVYFDILFPAQSQNKYQVKVVLDMKNNRININHDFSLSQNKSALLAIKQQGVLEPFFQIAKEKNYDTSDWEQILRSSLFAAGFLNKNIFEYPGDSAFLAYAVLVQIASVKRGASRTPS
ncbi:MAG: hypothetical protein HYX61_01360 [Gammaproteobacteria bacterium]|jgi:hypothetical protein|nr:hypothetical protein [Gammaproteobacteria bacterium]